MIIIVFTLVLYFLVATTLVALAVMPRFRAAVWSGPRKGWTSLLTRWQGMRFAGQRSAHPGYIHSEKVQDAENRRTATTKKCLAAACLLIVVPLAALSWRYWHAIETFDHTDAYAKDERIAALLTGEKLTPPAPLPPEVFLTRDVSLAMPLARYASRDWTLLDEDFRQRVLMVYRLMLEQHGYEMVLLEGYRSPERQAQLTSLGSGVTQAGPGRSYHQHGLAVDSAFLRGGKVLISEQDPWAMRGYELYGQVAASLGLTWGGRWKGLADFGHIEWRRPGAMRPAFDVKGDAAPPRAAG